MPVPTATRPSLWCRSHPLGVRSGRNFFCIDLTSLHRTRPTALPLAAMHGRGRPGVPLDSLPDGSPLPYFTTRRRHEFKAVTKQLAWVCRDCGYLHTGVNMPIFTEDTQTLRIKCDNTSCHATNTLHIPAVGRWGITKQLKPAKQQLHNIPELVST